MKRMCKAASAATVALIALAAAGCAAAGGGSAASAQQPVANEASASATAPARFVGYKWLVTSIISHGKQTPIPSAHQENQVYVVFTPNGQFGANDPINFHQATYRLVGDGFTTNDVVVGAVGSAGGNAAFLLTLDAIAAFGDGVHAKATVTGNRLVISVGGFLLNCQRDGTSGSSLF
jgi:hypothetical protein